VAVETVAEPVDGVAEPVEALAVAEPAARASRLRSAARLGVEILTTVVLAAVLLFFVKTVLVQPFRVEQLSMQRTFQPGDDVLADQLTPHWSAYARGDVVVFQPPAGWESSGTPLVKRVIGLAGETVEVRADGRVYVNGAALDEPYLFRNDAGVAEPTVADRASWVVGEGSLFVMGDHRAESADSRVFGTIPVSSVIGRVFVRYWPLDALGIVQRPAYPGVPAP
jgi:signal peptidase I